MWTHAELLTAAQAALLGPAAVTGGYDGKSVTVQGDDLVVRFGWRQHPRQFQVRISLNEPEHGPWTGVPTASAAEWVNEVSGLLMEELDTGATQWAVRRERDGALELDLEAGPPTRSAYYVSETRSAGAWWLREQGLDVEKAVAAAIDGTLLVWMQMYVDNSRGEPVVAQIVIVRDEQGGPRRQASDGGRRATGGRDPDGPPRAVRHGRSRGRPRVQLVPAPGADRGRDASRRRRTGARRPQPLARP